MQLSSLRKMKEEKDKMEEENIFFFTEMKKMKRYFEKKLEEMKQTLLICNEENERLKEENERLRRGLRDGIDGNEGCKYRPLNPERKKDPKIKKRKLESLAPEGGVTKISSESDGENSPVCSRTKDLKEVGNNTEVGQPRLGYSE